ncbi:hypothetical protein ElyMa_001780100 [Elysia marginata]|uniref:Uncharacterized protein n=1 Tax=Elysia marginata TaxID=1093978 RepID=A0AAV4EDM0_9GAST|nr:hypothetical protein ElyMa_001780100 [Elysia marginata]
MEIRVVAAVELIEMVVVAAEVMAVVAEAVVIVIIEVAVVVIIEVVVVVIIEVVVVEEVEVVAVVAVVVVVVVVVVSKMTGHHNLKILIRWIMDYAIWDSNAEVYMGRSFPFTENELKAKTKDAGDK